MINMRLNFFNIYYYFHVKINSEIMTYREELLEKFSVFNSPDFIFNERYHKYTYKGVQYISVTTLLNKFKRPFDSDFWSKKKADERGVTQDVILKEWKESNNHSKSLGTNVHEYIEYFFNKEWHDLPPDMEQVNRINKFNKIYREKLYLLEPLLFEKKIFSKKYKIAGTIDALFTYKNKLYIFDWKTNKELNTDDSPKGHYGKMLAPFNDYYDNQHNEYSIQLSLYAEILKEWDIDVAGCYLCYLPPNDEEGVVLKCKNMRKQISDYLEYQDELITEKDSSFQK